MRIINISNLKVPISFILIELIFLSCGQQEIKIENKAENTGTQKFTLDTTVRENILNDTNAYKKFDSSKFVRAFEDIYFGDQRIGSKQTYYINDMPYRTLNSSFEDGGLAEFTLIANYPLNEQLFNDYKLNAIKIISKKFASPKYINEIKDGMVDRMFAENANKSAKNTIIPKDKYNIIYNYQWIKQDVSIKLGFQIDYNNDASIFNEKVYSPVINFKYLPAAQKKVKKEEQLLIKEADKF